MIATIIRYSITNRFLVLLISLILTIGGMVMVQKLPIDALPDLSDVQVILRITYPGQSPQIIENQVTYPLATTMQSVPGAKTVRGFSFFGDAYIYILFEDGVDLYWARTRVLEAMNSAKARLPKDADLSLGPDATGVGWIYQYALVDHSGKYSLADLRSLQDWFLKFELKTIPEVSEVASIGGMVRQYQVVINPQKLLQYGLSPMNIAEAINNANQETGGSAIEIAEAEYMVRSEGYLKTLADFRAIPILTDKNMSTTPITLGDVAHIQLAPEMRRGIAELDGKSEVVGAVILMRIGEDASSTIKAIKNKIANLQKSLPEGVEIVPTYDRSQIIERAIKNLTNKLLEEFLVVALVCLIFLWHWRSSMVAIITLPIAVILALALMKWQGINANIMSLGGIAIAIGAMVDAALVMIENAHKKIEHSSINNEGNSKINNYERWRLITESAVEVGPALFFSLLIITISFLPIFTLQAQEGRLFSPLALTKTYAMGISAILSITLIPVLMGYFIRGKIPNENKNPINRWLIALYKPLFNLAMKSPIITLIFAVLISVSAILPLSKMGGEFLPPLDEGDILYMPTALPGLSVGKAQELLQQTDRLIKTVPEVAQVFGKAGRAETATDPAPIEMFETTIRLKPKNEWRAGMTPEKIINQLEQTVKIPGLANIWVPPIRNRIDMLATGIKSPIGIKVAGNSLAEIDKVTAQIENLAKNTPGVSSALAERLTGGRYINITIDRFLASRYGLNIAEVNSYVSSAIGGMNVGEVLDGQARYPINVRYPRELRDSISAIRNLPIKTMNGAQISLSTIAKIEITSGASMIKSENARLSGWVFVDVRGDDLVSVVNRLKDKFDKELKLPPSVSLSYSGQFEFYERAQERLKIVVPATLLIIFILLFLTFKRVSEALLLMVTLPFALTGGIWLMWVLGYHQSIATAVGFIALAGLAAEFGVVMLMYLRQAISEKIQSQTSINNTELKAAIFEGAVQRLRPKSMTVAVILGGLFPIMIGEGTGSEMMQRIAAPMVGGMITAPLLSMFVIPAAYYLMRRNNLTKTAK